MSILLQLSWKPYPFGVGEQWGNVFEHLAFRKVCILLPCKREAETQPAQGGLFLGFGWYLALAWNLWVWEGLERILTQNILLNCTWEMKKLLLYFDRIIFIKIYIHEQSWVSGLCCESYWDWTVPNVTQVSWKAWPLPSSFVGSLQGLGVSSRTLKTFARPQRT